MDRGTDITIVSDSDIWRIIPVLLSYFLVISISFSIFQRSSSEYFLSIIPASLRSMVIFSIEFWRE